MWRVAILLAALAIAPAAEAQEAGDSVWSSAIPVWLMVKDGNEAGVHEVRVAIEWDDPGTTLWFARSLDEGEIVVLIPVSEDAGEDDLADGCRHLGPAMEHGAGGLWEGKPEGASCKAPQADKLPLVGVTLSGHAMACKDAPRKDGTVEAGTRYFGCYWAKKPG